MTAVARSWASFAGSAKRPGRAYDGKDELVRAAMDAMAAASPRTLAPLAGRDAAGVIDGFLDGWQAILEGSDYAAGCSVLGITVTAESAEVRAEAASVFEAWQTGLTALLEAGGVPSESAAAVSWTLIAGAEGAVALCRAQRSLAPLDAVRDQLKKLVTT
jgi:hypothetical protein